MISQTTFYATQNLRTCAHQNLENPWKYFSEVEARSIEKFGNLIVLPN